MDRYKAAELAKSMIQKFKDEGHIDQTWRFRWSRSKRVLGCCNYRKRAISLSSHFVIVATEEQVTDTILHELVHAKLGPGFGHGAVWKSTAIKFGAKPQRCASYAELNDIPARFTGTCPSCGQIFKAYRRLKNMEKRICSKRACKARGMYVVWSTYKKGVV